MLREIVVKDCVLDIKLLNGLFVGHINREHNMDSDSIDNRTKGISVVQIKYLCVVFGKEVSFEAALYRAIREIFDLKHLFKTYKIGDGKSRNQNPGTIVLQSSNLVIHNHKRSRILDSRFEAFGLS